MQPPVPVLALALFATILPTASWGEETYTVLGPGSISCGQFLKDDPRMQSSDLFWIEGFLTGANAFSDDGHAGKNTDYEGRKGWLTNYCQSNPLSHLSDAARAMRDELIAKNMFRAK